MSGTALFLRKEERYIKVPIEEILFVNAAGSYLHIVTPGNEFSLSQNLSQFARKNPIPSLIRVHRSYLVNLLRIEAYDQSSVYVGDRRIPIGESYRNSLMEAIRSL